MSNVNEIMTEKRTIIKDVPNGTDFQVGQGFPKCDKLSPGGKGFPRVGASHQLATLRGTRRTAALGVRMLSVQEMPTVRQPTLAQCSHSAPNS